MTKKTVCFAAFSAGAMLVGGGVASAKEADPTSSQRSTHLHTVAAGESLSTISQAELGTSDRWVELFALNRVVIASPDLIEVGQAIEIPSTTEAVPAARPASGDANLAAVRACESGGNYGAVSANGRYRGAYQFDRATWESVGGRGDPALASPSEQDARAVQLRSQQASNPWPNCS